MLLQKPGSNGGDDVTERGAVPEAWVGREVRLRYVDADVPRSIDCTVREVNDRGVCAAVDDVPSFFPWNSIVRIDLDPPARGWSR